MRDALQQLRERYASLREYAHEHDLAAPLKRASIGLAAILVVLVLWLLPRYQVRHSSGVPAEKRFDSEDEARKTLAQILGGTVVLLGLYFSGRTFGLSREGQITDRFTKAIEQLGKTDGTGPNIEVRLGAIYALERIAIDSPRDHWTIMEILTAYVRQNAPYRPHAPYIPLEKPRTDVQAVLTVIGRRKRGIKRERSTQRLDLSRCHLVGAFLSGGNFETAFLLGVNLRGAELRRADLRRANLADANLQSADLKKALLTRTNLQKTHLNGADLFQADLQQAKLIKANLQDTNLRDVNLKGANIYEAEFRWASGLDVAQVKSATGWETASYPPYFRAELGLAPDPTEHPVPAPPQ